MKPVRFLLTLALVLGISAAINTQANHGLTLRSTALVASSVATVAPSVFDPTSYFTAGAIKQFWAAEDAGSADGDLVSSWAARTGSKTVTGTTTARPTFKKGSGIYDGIRPVVRFNGSANVLTVSDSGLPTGDVTVVMLVKTKASYSSNEYACPCAYGTAATGKLVAPLFGNDGSNGANFCGWTQSGSSGGVIDSTGKWIVMMVEKTGTTWRTRRNRDGGQTKTSINTGTTLGGTLAIGANIDGTLKCDMDLRYLIIANEVLSEANAWILTEALLREAETPATSYVTAGGNDGTAVRGDAGRPYATIDAALTASYAASIHVNSCQRDTINIGAGTFAPITAGKLKSRNTLVGAGKPVVDNSTTPTQLTTGTIIKGPFDATDLSDINYSAFGVDSGSVVCTALYSGTAQGAIAVAGPAAHPAVALNLHKPGCSFTDLIGLCKDSTSLVHASAFENMTGATISGIDGWNGFAGCVTKTDNSTISDCHGHLNKGAISGGIYVKTSLYALNYSNTYSNCSADGCDNGLYFVAEGAVVTDNTLTSITVTNCTIPVSFSSGGTGGTITNTSINVAVGTGASGDAVSMDICNNVTLSGTISGATGDDVQLSAGCVNCHLVSLVCNNAGAYGVNNLSTTTTGSGQLSGSGNSSGLLGGNALLP